MGTLVCVAAISDTCFWHWQLSSEWTELRENANGMNATYLLEIFRKRQRRLRYAYSSAVQLHVHWTIARTGYLLRALRGRNRIYWRFCIGVFVHTYIPTNTASTCSSTKLEERRETATAFARPSVPYLHPQVQNPHTGKHTALTVYSTNLEYEFESSHPPPRNRTKWP